MLPMKVSDHKKGSVQKQLIYEINYIFVLYLICFSNSICCSSYIRVAAKEKFFLLFLSIDFSCIHDEFSDSKKYVFR